MIISSRTPEGWPDLRESEKQAVLEQLKDELEIIGVTVAESDEPWWKFW